MAKAKAEKTTPGDDTRTVAHHLDSAAFNLAHSQRHVASAQSSPATAPFNLSHAAKHLAETKATLSKLRDSVAKKVPGVEPELGKLEKAKKK